MGETAPPPDAKGQARIGKMGDSIAILSAIRQEGLLSLTFGLAMLVAAVALGVVFRNTVKQFVRDVTAKKFGRGKQAQSLRRLGRAVMLLGLMLVTTAFAMSYLLDAGAWLAVNDPRTSLVLRAGAAGILPPSP
jgi:F0F1-type ATP synthase membrane subunit c/vacuolar-type H+-ATPase subunit K